MLSINATFLFVLVSFIIFIFLMNLICYKPIMKIVEAREKFYEKNKKTVEETTGKIDEIKKEADAEISSAKLESANLLKSTNENNAKAKEEAIKNKKADIVSKITSFENTLNASATLAKSQLKAQVEDYVKNTVSKLLVVDKESVQVDNSKIDEILQ